MKLFSVHPLPRSKRAFVEAMEYHETPKEFMETIELKSNELAPKNFTGIAIFESGTKCWYKNGFYHREDGPAIEYSNGDKKWFVNGKRHRLNGPAIEYSDGSKAWYKENKLHREGGPAIENSNGDKKWCKNGFYHREDGPAIEYSNGDKKWCKNGFYHREDGPAIEYSNGDKKWCKNGKLHRVDGPAIEYSDGTKEWHIEGKGYSEENFNKEIEKRNQQAKLSSEKTMKIIKLKQDELVPKNFTGIVEYVSGNKYWFKEGNHHRIDGPAIEYLNGNKYWYIEGKGYSEENFKKEIEKMNKEINTETNAKTEIAVPLTAAVASLKNDTTPAREDKMAKNTKEKVLEIAKSDAVEVAKRVAVNQISKGIQALLVEMISAGKKGKQKTALKSNLEEFFSSEAGRAIIKFVSGLALPQLAMYAEKAGMLKPQHVMVIGMLSEEMRIQGETDATLQVIETVSPMLSMLTSGLTSQIGGFFSSVEETVEPVRVALGSGTELNSTHEEVVGSSMVAMKTAIG